MVDAVTLSFMFPGSTRDAKGLESIFRILESEPLLTPTHASPEDRKRFPYDLADLVARMAVKPFTGLELWRTKTPRYEGMLSTLAQTHNQLEVEFAPPFGEGVVQKFFDASTRLAAALKPEYAFVHLLQRGWDGSEQYNNGVRIELRDLARLGLNRVHARTWFAGDIAQAIGEKHLLKLPGTQRTEWGGIQLDLAEQPWTADVKALYRRQCEVVDALRPLGVVADYSGAPRERKPAEKWPRLSWRIAGYAK